MDNPSRDTRRILGAFNDMNQLLLDLRNNRLGPIPKAFALKHASQLYSFCGRDGSKLTGMTSKEFRKLIKYYQSDIQNQKLPGAPELLKSYSPWLTNFHYANFAEVSEYTLNAVMFSKLNMLFSLGYRNTWSIYR
jgi:hypothetical protein